MSAMHDCPRFESCSCNTCPLETEQRFGLPGEETCKARRKTREAIAARHGIPSRGLLPREIRSDARKAAWAALPEEEKARRLEKLAPFKGSAAFLTRSQKANDSGNTRATPNFSLAKKARE